MVLGGGRLNMHLLLGIPFAMLLIAMMLFRKKNEKDLFLLYGLGSITIAILIRIIF